MNLDPLGWILIREDRWRFRFALPDSRVGSTLAGMNQGGLPVEVIRLWRPTCEYLIPIARFREGNRTFQFQYFLLQSRNGRPFLLQKRGLSDIVGLLFSTFWVRFGKGFRTL